MNTPIMPTSNSKEADHISVKITFKDGSTKYFEGWETDNDGSIELVNYESDSDTDITTIEELLEQDIIEIEIEYTESTLIKWEKRLWKNEQRATSNS